MNEGRYLVLAPLLNRLLADGLIEEWVGPSQEPRAKMEPLVKPEDRSRIHYLEDGENPFKTYGEAADYIQSLGREIPGLDMGRVFSAEKYMDRHFPAGLRDVANAFRFLKTIREKHDLTMAFSDFPASSMDMMIYYMMRAREARTFYFTSNRFGVSLHYVDSLEGPKADVRDLYIHFRKAMAAEDREEAAKYLEDFLVNKRKPYYFNPKLNRGGLLAKLARAWKSGTLTHPVAALRGFRSKRRLEAVQRVIPYAKLDPSDRIIFHPLQYLPEASTYVRAPHYRDHVAVANLLAMRIPPGYTLYIKDHPLLKLRRTPEFYRDLLHFPNVKLLRYDADTHEVIHAAELTVTQSSTAGLESLLYGVPVLLLGDADIVYQDFHGVVKLGDMPMNTGIEKALAVRIADEDKYPMILSMLRAGYPGKMDDPRWDKDILTPENIEHLYAFVKAKLALIPAAA